MASRKWAGRLALGTHKAESEQEMEPNNKALRSAPSDPLPPARPRLLKVPQGLKQSYQLETKCSNS